MPFLPTIHPWRHWIMSRMSTWHSTLLVVSTRKMEFLIEFAEIPSEKDIKLNKSGASVLILLHFSVGLDLSNHDVLVLWPNIFHTTWLDLSPSLTPPLHFRAPSPSKEWALSVRPPPGSQGLTSSVQGTSAPLTRAWSRLSSPSSFTAGPWRV